MTTSTMVLIVVVAVVAILLIATIAWAARNKRTQHRRVEAGTSATKPPSSPTRWGNAKRSPTRPRPRAAPPKPRPTPRPRTRRAYNTKRKCVATTRPPPATRSTRSSSAPTRSIRTRTPTATHREKTPKPARQLANPRRQARPTPDAQIRVTSRTPTPGLGRVIADGPLPWQRQLRLARRCVGRIRRRVRARHMRHLAQQHVPDN